MRICIFTDSFYPYISGVTTALVTQANALAKKGHQVIIFAPITKKQFDASVLDDAIIFHRIAFSLPAPRFKNLRIAIPTVIKPYGILRKFAPDIIHVHTEFGTGWEGLICARLLRVPIIGNFSTFYGDEGYLKLLKLPRTKLVSNSVWKYGVTFLEACDTVLCPSQVGQRALRSHGFRKKPIVLSYGVSDIPLVSEQSIKKLRASYGIPSGVHFVYLGRISTEKSLDVAVQAFRSIHYDYPEAKFTIIGDGVYMPELKRMIKKYKLPVILTGCVEHDTLIAKNYPRLGDIFLMPSRTETQGIVVLEAMACGIPVVGVNENGVAELVTHGVDGFLVDVHDPIAMAHYAKRLYLDARLRSKMSKAARESASKHSVEVIADKLERIYRSTIHSYKRSKKKALPDILRNSFLKAKEKLK